MKIRFVTRIHTRNNFLLAVISLLPIVIGFFFLDTMKLLSDIYFILLSLLILLTLMSVSPLVFIFFQETIQAKWSKNLYSLFPDIRKYYKVLLVIWLIIFSLYNFFFQAAELTYLAGRIWFYPLFIFFRTAIFLFSNLYIYNKVFPCYMTHSYESNLRKVSPFYLIFVISGIFFFSWDWLIFPLQNPHAGIVAIQTIITAFALSVVSLIFFNRNKLRGSDLINDLSRYFLLFCCLWMYLFFCHLLISGYEGSMAISLIKSDLIIRILTIILPIFLCFVFPFSILSAYRNRIQVKKLAVASLSFFTGNFFWILLFFSGRLDNNLIITLFLIILPAAFFFSLLRKYDSDMEP
ncbi:MAG TPA: hypothetical protein P5050_07955 [Bacteroidia bacterium]|nr:hypothetical protein [Bacteroidia bacterium]HRS59138.1 hypothetical protein [Bacteroidia bacterium]HRU67434.1 hypothetical protein [Bacteroidia bacterium]